MASLFEEFEIHRISEPLFEIAGHPIAFTTSALWMFIGVACAVLFFLIAIRKKAVVPGRMQMSAEVLYDMVGNLVADNAGEKARPYFPFMFSIFCFVFFANLVGLIPHSVSYTSHVIVNLALSFTLFFVIVMIGFIRHGFHFFGVFLPAGTPVFAAPVMYCIEFFSFWVRPFSLSLRLFGNMLAGHLLLQVFASLMAGLLTAGWLSGLSIFPLAAELAIIAFEFFVAFLQAYVYSILSSVYLHDAIEMH
ncbi:MAG: F0F1 ATP synthase subunit A [Alphaproteobacteria bacterium]|nr:F0F1 ATP synthase subunit A [Alphaproteobacteria bacterium]